MSTIAPVDTSEKSARRLSLRANFSWTFVGNLVYAASQWGMLIVLAKLGTPEMVGQFSLALAVTAPVIMFTNMALRPVQATDAKRDYLFADYLGLRLISTLVALLLIAGLARFGGYRQETALIILVIGLAKCFEAISDVFYGLLQQRERMDRIAQSMMIKGPLSLAVLGLTIWRTGSVLWGVMALAVVWAALLVLYDIRSGRLIMQAAGDEKQSLQPRLYWPVLRQLLWLALPLSVVVLFSSLSTNIPRYVVEQHWGEATLGIYAAMAYLIVAGRTIVSALGQAVSPRLAQYYMEGKVSAFRWLLLRLVGIGLVLGTGAVAVAAVAGEQILTLIYTPEYATHADVFVLLMVAAGLSYASSFLGYGMTAARYFKIQAILSGMNVAIILLMSLVFIPIYGMRGAALSSCILFTFQIMTRLLVLSYIGQQATKETRL